MRFATEMGFSKRVQSISLGQGQGPVAEKLIDQGLERGDWIFLQVSEKKIHTQNNNCFENNLILTKFYMYLVKYQLRFLRRKIFNQY